MVCIVYDYGIGNKDMKFHCIVKFGVLSQKMPK